MASLSRKPLAPRSLPQKRPRSPDHHDPLPTTKRVRPAPRPTHDPAKDRKNPDKEKVKAQLKAEFKDKYCRAFPSWIFYFDSENTQAHPFEARIHQLGATIEDFFSKQVTHVITDRPIPSSVEKEKENLSKSSKTFLKSPIRLKGRVGEETKSAPGFDLVAKAISFGLKVWSPTKLESVLARCIDQPPVNKSILPCQQTAAPHPQRALTRLLQSEKIHGSTERDPTQKRHDYRYFSRATHFVLVEDLRQELATLIAHEYPPPKRDAGLKTPWPTLHCHPHSRGPFIVFDEKEKKRWEKMQQIGKGVKIGHTDRGKRNDCDARIETMKNAVHAKDSVKPGADLRRSVSLNNLRRQMSHKDPVVEDVGGFGDNVDHVNASGFLASGYMAASGNSVGLTSTTGTTSTSGYFLRNGPLPSALVGQIKKEVVTSRKFPSANKLQPASLMGPPKTVPHRQPVLKKSKSTNTLKLPKREEGSKPGYCESCRQKFDDFKAHVSGRKHRTFAMEAANFAQLDCVLARVQRRTRREVEEEQRKRVLTRRSRCAEGHRHIIGINWHLSK